MLKETGKWFETSALNIIVLKLIFKNQFVRILYIIFDFFLLTLEAFLVIAT